MTETSALISVIVPVYRAEQYLDRCAASILAQDCADFELILVDDGSPDRCGAMCEAWAQRDRRVRVLYKANGGQSSARNLGLDHARGAYIAFIDSDDYVTPDYLSALLRLFELSPGAGFTVTNHNVVRGEKAGPDAESERETVVLTRSRAFEEVLFHGYINIAPWGKLFRRDMFDGLRFPEGRLFEDTWIFGDLLNRTETVVFSNVCRYNYIIHGASTVHSGFREQSLQYIEAAEKLARDAGPEFKVGGVRRVNHARLSTLRLMERCGAAYLPIRAELRRDILRDAPAYIRDPRTPRRDRLAVAMLRLGLRPFYLGWKLYERLR